jgi:Tail-tube assembly protein
MASTKSKLNKLNGDFDSKSTSLLFPSDLLVDGADQLCMTIFFNVIKNGQAKINFNGGLAQSKNNLTSAYGDVPVLHKQSRGLQRDNGGAKVFSNTFSRSDQSITLPMPKGLNFNSKVNWSTVDLGASAMVIDQGSDLSDMSGKAAAKLVGQSALSTVGSIVSQFKGLKGKELVELATATVANNYAETLFKNVDNRSFSFNWTLTPRNAKEAEALDNIIRVLRFHQLPEFKEDVGNGNAFLLYPSSMDIVFWAEGKPNRYVPRISTCALTNIDTNYTPNGAFIKTASGSPNSYTLALQFSELQTLHKGMVGTDVDGVGSAF